MATKKKLLQAAAGSAGGEPGLNVEQVFSTYLYEGNGSSQFAENEINLGQSYGSGSANFNGVDQRIDISSATNLQIGPADFTLEMFFFLKEDATVYDVLAIKGFNSQNSREYGFEFVGGGEIYYLYSTNGTGWQLPKVVTSGVTVGEWHHIAVSRDGSNLSVWFNGTRTYNDTNHSPTYHTGTDNFQIAGYNDGSTNALYSPAYFSNLRLVKGSVVYNPTSTSITVPTSELTNITNTSLLTLQGSSPFTDNSSSSHSLTNNGAKASTFGPFDAAEAGEGGLVWIKRRSGVDTHQLYDTERGAGNILVSSNTNAETNYPTGFTSFNSNGFSMGPQYGTNTSGHTYASWTFRKAPKFFDVVTYTGTGSARSIAHDLNADVGMLIVKATSGTTSWRIWTNALSGTERLQFDTSAKATTNTSWNGQTPTSTEFYLGADTNTNNSGTEYVAYLFAHNDGDGDFGPDADQDIIKCGVVSHTQSNGSDSEVNLGFEPQWLLIKNSNVAGYAWAIFDTMRGWTVQTEDNYLQAESSDAESVTSSGTGWIDVTSTGFKIQDAMFGNGDYIYMAIRRPMAVPTDATDVFDVTTGSNSDPSFTAGFTVDFGLAKEPSTSTYSFRAGTRLLQGTFLETENTNAEAAGSSYQFDYQDSWHSGSLSSSWYSWMWKRAPNYFDVVAYTGNGTVNHQISHNLQAVPELLLFKPRGSGSWIVKSKFDDDASGVSTRNNYLLLNFTNAYSTSADYRLSSNETSFTLSTNGGFDNGSGWNASGSNYIAYLFASLDGVSKVGSYTGDGTTGRVIDCGFSNGARFVLIKVTSHTGDWWLFDTERGITTSVAYGLRLNDTAAQIPSGSPTQDYHDRIDPSSSGFIVNHTSALGINESGKDYIFYAIA